MDEQAVREHAQAHADALLAGDIGKAAEEMSNELRSNLGPFRRHVADADDQGQHRVGRVDPDRLEVVLHLVGEGDTLRLETRWKDRDGRPTIVEASRVQEEPMPEQVAETDSSAG